MTPPDALTIAAHRAKFADQDLRNMVRLNAHPALIEKAARALIESWIFLGHARATCER